jgi:hypothetical protein
MNIIGLGKAGCNIAECFQKYPQYNVFQIDVDKVGKRCYNIKYEKGPEEYEQNAPDFSDFLSQIRGETLLIVGGSGHISALALRIIEQLETKSETDILYIRPDPLLLGSLEKKHEKVTYNVLQHYARSAAIRRLYLVSNLALEEVVGDISVMDYYNKINDLLVSTVHMINVFRNDTPVMGGLRSPAETGRICTFGIFDMKENAENLFFSLDSIRDMGYIYGVGEKRLREEGSLHKKIVSQMREKALDETVNVSFGVFPTQYENDYGYLLAYSPHIQN